MTQNIKEMLELAVDHIDYWEGTLVARLIEYDIANNDYKALSEHLKQSAAIMFESEYESKYADYSSDERAEAMHQEKL